jgi:hypothetical protein
MCNCNNRYLRLPPCGNFLLPPALAVSPKSLFLKAEKIDQGANDTLARDFNQASISWSNHPTARAKADGLGKCRVVAFASLIDAVIFQR